MHTALCFLLSSVNGSVWIDPCPVFLVPLIVKERSCNLNWHLALDEEGVTRWSMKLVNSGTTTLFLTHNWPQNQYHSSFILQSPASRLYTANHKIGYSCSKRYFSWQKWLFNIFFVRIGKSIIKWSECHKSHEFLSIILDFMIKRR